MPASPVLVRIPLAMLVATLLAALGLLVSASSASALTCTDASLFSMPPANAPLPGSCFEGYDGNQVDPDGAAPTPPNRLDWQSAVGTTGLVPAPDYVVAKNDSQFGPGGDEENPDSWTFNIGSLGSDKYDALAAWTFREPSTTDLFLALAFVRASNNGETHLSFELNQKQPGYRTATETGTGGRTIKVPTRSTGDLLITYSVSNNDTPPRVGLCKWSGDEHSGHWQDFAGVNVGDECPALLPAVAQASLNKSDIDGAQNYLQPGTDVDTGQFAEASINLTEALKAAGGNPNQPDPCVSFGYMWLHSRSAPSITSNQQDYILPSDVINVANCAVTGKKFHDIDGDGLPQEGNEPGLGGWTIFADYDNDGVLDNDKTAPFVNDNDGVVEPGEEEPYDITAPVNGNDLRPTGSYTIANIQNGTWNIREVGQAGWSCTFPNPCSHQVGMTGKLVENINFGNNQPGKVRVVKSTTPDGDATDFDFDPSANLAAGNFTLRDGQAAQEYTVQAGTYTVTELAESGWDLAGFECSDSDSSGEGSTATYTVAAGEVVTCTFTNVKRGTVRVVKSTDPDDDPTAFDFDPSANLADENFTRADDQAAMEFSVAPGSYSVMELAEDGWDLAGIECSDGDSSGQGSTANYVVAAGETVTCTFTNVKRGTVRVVKSTDPDGDETAFDFDPSANLADENFTRADNQAAKEFSVAPGSYSVTELAEDGWDLTGIECSDGDSSGDGSTANYMVAAGEVVTCTFTNVKRGAVRVVKSTDPDGDETAFDFDPSANLADENFTRADDQAAKEFSVAPGTYSVAELAEDGWDLTGIECSDGDSSGDGSTANYVVGAGEVVTCTFTNVKRGAVRVVKSTDPDGDETAFDFDPSANLADENFTRADNQAAMEFSVAPGSYSVTELAEAGWDLESIECSDGDSSGQGSTANYVVGAGEVVTCTFTNVKRGAVRVVKSTDPDGDETAFDFDPSANLADENFTRADNQAAMEFSVAPGSYSVTELAEAGWDLESIECSDGDSSGQGSTANYVVGAGEVVTCTFTNVKRGAVRVVKSTDPDGDETAFDFDPSANLADENFSRADDQAAMEFSVAPGSYSVMELAEDGWDLAGIECSDSDSSGEGSTANYVVAAGETVTCTFTNVKRGMVRVVKSTDPDGDPTEFDFDPSANLADENFTRADNEAAMEFSVAPGSYSVAELAEDGWDLTGIECSDGDSSGDGSTANYVVAAGEVVTCTFHNVKRGMVRVVKSTDPDGDQTAFDFDPSANLADENFSRADNQAAKEFSVEPGTYSVTELAEAGWDLESIECSDSDSSGNGSTANYMVAAGEVVTCTFHNVKRGMVRVVKSTDPDGDQTAFDFDPSANLADENFSRADNQAAMEFSVAPGTYGVSELAEAGWDLESIECSDSDSSGEGSTANYVVGAGEVVTCTFHNVKRGAVRVVKSTDPDGDETAFDFDPSANLADENFSRADDQAAKEFSVEPGTYSVSELAEAGWDLESIECSDGDSSGNGSTATYKVAAGEVVTCTFTNLKRGTIEIEKQTDPDEPAESANRFTFTGSDPLAANSNLDPQSFDLADDGVKTIGSVKPNNGATAYEVAEAAQIGYRLTDIDCGQDADSGGSTESRVASIHVSPGETVRCTFTNTKLTTGTLVLKEGTLQAHHGDPLTYTFDVTNTGNSPLHDVRVTDDRCSPVSQTPTSKVNDDGDDLLELGEHWVFTCTYNAPAEHDAEEEDPIHNIATAAAKDEQDQPVSDTDEHDTDLLHPAIAVDKTLRRGDAGEFVQGPIRVHEGDTIQYRFEVTNAGDTPLAVEFSDPRCDAGSLSGPTGDADQDGKLDLAETWVYRCSHAVTAQSGDPVVNTVTVTGTDPIGGPKGTDTDTDTAEADVLHPAIAVDKTLRRGDAGEFVQGPIRVHEGDTIQYRFEVTNAGDTPLAVEFSDPRCDAGSLSGPTGDADQDGKLDLAETWVYRCSHAVTAQSGDPVENTVTVTGTDDLGGKDTDTDSADAHVLHPDIEIDKQVDKQSAHVGDTLNYTFAVTNPGDTPLAVEFSDPRCDAGTLSGPTGDTDDDDKLDVGETWTYKCSHVVTEGDPNPLPNTAKVTGTDELGGNDTDEDSTSVTILKPGTLVVKEGNQYAYPGDTVTFTFAVTNNGNAPLTDVVVTDDRCAPVTRVSGDDVLDPGETWNYTCSKQIPAGHKIGDENPIRNVATATGKDPLGKTVSSTDDHLVKVLHPAVDIEKTGPATARAGNALEYTLTVTNPGDVPFAAQDVVVTDPRCDAPPVGPDTGSDATPGQLDPGDAWTYSCVAQTTGMPAGTFLNVAHVTARDFNGRTVSDTDEFTTLLEAQGVLPEREIVSGRARLRGPSGCVQGPFTATVRGRRIARVTFYRDGKKIKTINARRGQRVFRVRINPGKAVGIHRVTARIRFRAASRTRARTLRLSYQRCRRQVVRPRFTG